MGRKKKRPPLTEEEKREKQKEKAALAWRKSVEQPEQYQCPACGRKFVWQWTQHGSLACDPQRRIVVFDGPYDEHGLPREPLVLFEEHSGKLVCGRQANEKERRHFAKNGNLDGEVPWAIGRATHLSTCADWKYWLGGGTPHEKRVERRPKRTTEQADG